MGEPIKQLGYKIDDPDNFMTTDKAQFQVNIKGPNDKGNNNYWIYKLPIPQLDCNCALIMDLISCRQTLPMG